MNWKDNLRAASFRGVPFYVNSHAADGGRRIVKHEFPNRDKPSNEDMGRKQRSHSVEAYVLGDDYMLARDALLRACEAEGSAELVHPYLGTLKVNCESYSLRETVEEGRVARFTFTFIESGETVFPNALVDGAAVTAVAAKKAKAAAINDFKKKFSIKGLPEFALADATAQFNAATAGLRGIANKANEFASGKIGILGEINKFSGSLTSLMNAPGMLADSFFNVIHSVSNVFDSPFEAARRLADMFDFGTGSKAVSTTPATVSTATRERQAANRDAINALVQSAVTIEVAMIAPTATFETVQDAQNMRDVIAGQLDFLMENPLSSDDVYAAIQDVRTAVVRAVPPESVSLPNLVDFAPLKTLPALVVAYNLYEDASREAEIVTRNRVAYPGFVPAAAPLKVVADV